MVMDFEDFDDFDNDLFGDDDDKGKPTEELNDDDVLNNLIKKAEATNDDKKKKRKVTQKARPKLAEQELTGPKGLCALRKLFETWQPNENKNPYENLDDMMQKVEYWGHILYPKLNFDDFLTRVEQVGKKRAVKVYMNKLRNGMPLFEELDEKEGNKLDDDRKSESLERELSPIPDDDDVFFGSPVIAQKSNDALNSDEEDMFLQKTSSVNIDVDENADVPQQTNQSKRRRLVIDSDDEYSNESKENDPESFTGITKDISVASPHSPHKKKRRVVIDSDEEMDDKESKTTDMNEASSSPLKRRIIIDSDEEMDTTEPQTAGITEDSALDFIFD